MLNCMLAEDQQARDQDSDGGSESSDSSLALS